MKLDTDDGLRRALNAYADTTTTTPDAWEDILDRAETRRSRRRIGFSVGALTAAVAMIAAGVVWIARPDAPTSEDLVSAVDATTAQERFAFSLSAGLAGSAPTSAEGQFDKQRGVGWVRSTPAQLPMPPGASVSPPVPQTSGADAVFDRDRVYMRSDLVGTVASVPLDRPWVVFDRAADRDSLETIAAVSGRGNLLSIVDRVAADGGSGLIGQRPAPDSNLLPEGVEEVRGVKTTRYRIGVPEGMVATSLWIDGKGLVRRTQISDADYTDTVELYDFGEPLRYDVPPPSDVVDASTIALP